MESIPSNKNKSMFSQERYQFMLDAPFEISHMCCSVMKKSPMKHYAKETCRVPITAQMASESRLRTQIWLKQGCNAFDAKKPMSNPMAFWTESDVLLYIHTHFDEMMEWRKEEYRKVLEDNPIRFSISEIEEIIEETITYPIASVYGKVVKEKEIVGQIDLEDLGLFEFERPTLKTTGCDRTGCFACGFGQHHEKQCDSRIQKIIDFSNPNFADWMVRGGSFDEETGLWQPYKGLGLWFVYEWVNVHGGFNIWYPNREYYLEKYMTDETRRYLE